MKTFPIYHLQLHSIYRVSRIAIIFATLSSSVQYFLGQLSVASTELSSKKTLVDEGFFCFVPAGDSKLARNQSEAELLGLFSLTE